MSTGKYITQGMRKKMVWFDMQHFHLQKIAERVGCSESAVSKHLRAMQKNGDYQRFKAELQGAEPVTFDDERPAPEPEPEPPKMKNTGVNPEFEQAVDAMIAESDTANADENSANAEPDRLPHVIRSALDDKCCEINIDIETREAQIAELKAEIRALEAQKQDIQTWMEAHE